MNSFNKSRLEFTEWRKLSGKLKPMLLWRVEFAGFILEAYNDHHGNMVIIQLFEGVRGFKAYTPNTDFIKNLDLNSLREE